MSSNTAKQIAALQDLPMPALQERWRSLLGTEPPRYHRSFLVRRLAHRLQELAYGGLSQSARARLGLAPKNESRWNVIDRGLGQIERSEADGSEAIHTGADHP